MTAIAPRASKAPLTGAQKAAILCMSLGAEGAARILMRLGPSEVDAVSKAIVSIRAVPPEQIEAVLGEFQLVSREVESMAEGGEEFVREVLEKAIGTQRTRGVMERIRPQQEKPEQTGLRGATPDVLQAALKGESPQTLALVLAHLEPKVAAQMIAGMDPELSTDVLYRVARMDRVSPAVLNLVEKTIVNQSQTVAPQEMTATGGPSVVAQVLNQMPAGADTVILDAMGVRGPELAEQIRAFMFVFEDLRKIDDRSTQRLLRDIESRELAIGLKAASDELKAHIMKNMSERAAAALREELEMLGPVKVKDVEAAHASIIAIARGLQDAGEIVVERGGSDDDVIA
jgi:flagellar motor switch protein FliG